VSTRFFPMAQAVTPHAKKRSGDRHYGLLAFRTARQPDIRRWPSVPGALFRIGMNAVHTPTPARQVGRRLTPLARLDERVFTGTNR